MRRRPSEFETIRLYSDPDPTGPGALRKPVWAVAPESIIVSPIRGSCVGWSEIEIWGWAWSDRPVRSVEVSVDSGRTWIDARVDTAVGHAWQRFSVSWSPSQPGPTELRCRATDANGRTQPSDGARNAIHCVAVTVVGR
jgi:hypothetical protein